MVQVENHHVGVDVAVTPKAPTRKLSFGMRAMLGKQAEQEAEPITEEPTARQQLLMWLFLFIHTLLYGIMVFLFRLQAYMADGHPEREISNGTSHAFFIFGFATAALPLIGYNMQHFKPSNFRRVHIFAALAGLANNIGVNGYMLLMSAGGEASTLAPLLSLYILLPVIAGFTFMGDKVTFRKLFGIALAISAALLFAFSESSTSFKLSDGSELGKFFLVFIFYGISTILLQVISGTNNAQLAVSYNLSVFAYIGSGMIAVFAIHGDFSTTWTLSHTIIFMAGVSGALANMCFIMLSRVMPQQASVVAPLSSTYVLYPTILGLSVLHEAAGPLKIVGICLALIATPLMAIPSFRDVIKSFICCGPNSAVTPSHPIENSTLIIPDDKFSLELEIFEVIVTPEDGNDPHDPANNDTDMSTERDEISLETIASSESTPGAAIYAL